MPEPHQPAANLEELRRRFEEEPGSRVYLQLAEEYRRLGLPEQAIEVLEKGLAQRPNDLSGQVALGRCRLELGQVDDAVEVLGNVISRDAAHLVANKLLIEAHLRQHDADRAHQRLELYKLLNDRDPEIDDLEQRLKALRRSQREKIEPAAGPAVELTDTGELAAVDDLLVTDASTEEPAPESREIEAQVEPAEAESAKFEVARAEPGEPPAAAPPPASAAPEAAPAGMVFFALSPPEPPDLDALWRETEGQPHVRRWRTEPFGPLPPPAARRRGDDVFPIEAPEPAAEAPVEAPAAEEASARFETAEDLEPIDEEPMAEAPFEEPAVEAPPIDEEPVAEAPFEETPVEEAPVEEAPVRFETAEDLEPIEVESEPTTVAIDLPQPFEPRAPEVVERATAAPPEPAAGEGSAEEDGPDATVTLAKLYVKQGHLDEARRIYRRVLERDPGHAEARAALEKLVQAAPERLTADRLLAEAPTGEVPQGLTAKKVLVLKSYLRRLRRHRHVR